MVGNYLSVKVQTTLRYVVAETGRKTFLAGNFSLRSDSLVPAMN